ncbi:MAG: DUF4373 domain-containing protein [Melioribacteraceae bacterium]|nr:DUF4373 domain-containing protein [Melioribacteraceae bacterium]
MARPTRQGIDYFPLDVEFDDKTEMFLIEKEAVGLAILISIWQLIYKNEGYYIKYNNDLSLLIKKRISIDINSINDCIKSAVNRNIFDKELFSKEGILTSRAIQKRFFEAAKRKKQVLVFRNYLLIDINSYNNTVIVNINSVNADNNSTNVKEEVKENVNVKGEGNKIYVPPNIPFQSSEEPFSKSINLWRQIYLSAPGIVEQDFTNDLIEKYGFKKAKRILYELREKNFKSVNTMKSAIDEFGNIKPKENIGGFINSTNGNETSGATDEELAEIANRRAARQNQHIQSG